MCKEVISAEECANLCKDFNSPNDDISTLREEMVKAEQHAGLKKELHLQDGDASTTREELAKASSALRDESAKSDKMRDRLETLGREQEQHTATVKALKYDLKALHGGNVGPETSLQEHMRLLIER